MRRRGAARELCGRGDAPLLTTPYCNTGGAKLAHAHGCEERNLVIMSIFHRAFKIKGLRRKKCGGGS